MTFASDPPPSAARHPGMVYLPRVIGLALGSLCVGAAISATARTESWLWILLIGYALVWPHLAYLRSSRSANPRDAENGNLLFDSLMGGFWVVAMQGLLLPSMLIIAMLSMNNVAMGGMRLMGQGVLAHLVGASVGLAALEWHFRPESNLVVQIFCTPFLIVYPLLIGGVAFRLAQRLNRQRKELRLLSEIDPLSGIYNRRFFEHRLAEEFENFKRHDSPVSLVVADIDHFKGINDNHGHPVGDSAIRAVGQVLRQQVRLADVAARIGGDEFVVLMPFTGTDEALELVQRLQLAFSQLVVGDDRLTGTTLSFGIAAPRPDMQSPEHWLELADGALYRAKARKRGSVEVSAAGLLPA